MITTNIAIFISGKGSNALNLITYFKNSEQFKICLIFATKENPELERSCAINTIAFHFSSKNGLELEKDQIQLCLANSISWVVLAGYLKHISPSFIALFPNRIINIHPSLLPKFGGKGMYGIHVHQAVLENKEQETGITIHYVNEHYDEGEFIFQKSVNIEDFKTAEEIAHKIHELEHKYFSTVISEVLNSKF